MPKGSVPSPDERRAAALKRLRAGCAKARQAPVPFFFCPKDEHGDPVLLVGKRIKSEAKKVLAKAQLKRPVVRGKVTYANSAYVFQADKPGENKFKKALKDHFGKEWAVLKSASIVPLEDGGDEPTMQEELKAEVARRAARQRERAAEEAHDASAYWAARRDELEADLGSKLDVVSSAEEAIAARLDSGSTEAVAGRLEKNHSRLQRLQQQAEAALSKARGARPDSDACVTWLEEYLEECATIAASFDEHRDTVEDLDTAPEETASTAAPTATGGDEARDAREDQILKTLADLGGTSSPSAWRHAAGDARKAMKAWATSHTFTDDRSRRAMNARFKALKLARRFIDELPAIEQALEQEVSLIETQQEAHNPADGLSRLIAVDSDLQSLGGQLEAARTGLLRVDKDIDEPRMFAAMLGKTTRLRKDIRDTAALLVATQAALQLALSEASTNAELDDLEERIGRELRALPLKAEASAWLRDAAELGSHIGAWRTLSGKLSVPRKSRELDATAAVLSAQTRLIRRTDGAEERLASLEQALGALPNDTTDIAAVSAIRLKAEKLEARLLSAQDLLGQASNTFHGPRIFQGLLGRLSAQESRTWSFLNDAAAAEQAALRAARDSMGEDALRAQLAEMLVTERKAHGQALQLLTHFGEWSTRATRTKRDLDFWHNLAQDLPERPKGYDEVDGVLSLLDAAAVLLPKIESEETEFERRRKIYFAQTSDDPDDNLKLHMILEQMHGRLAPQVARLQALHKRARSLGWPLFEGLARNAQEQLDSLEDLEIRLYRMHHDMEGGAPDQKTTEEGGTLDLDYSEKEAVKQIVARRVDGYLERENRERSRRREDPISASDVPEEIVSQFARIARRVVLARRKGDDGTSRY